METKWWLDWAYGSVAFCEFVEQVQAGGADLSVSYKAQLEFRSKLTSLIAEDNEVAHHMHVLVAGRLESTETDVLSETAYSLTAEGCGRLCELLNAPQALGVRSEPGEQEWAYANYLGAMAIIPQWVNVTAVYDSQVETDRKLYEKVAVELIHAANDDYGFGGDAFAYWRSNFPLWQQENPTRAALAFAAMALLSVPCSEACAERLFSIFDWLYDDRRRRASLATLGDELVVRMWQVYTGQMAGLPYVV